MAWTGQDERQELELSLLSHFVIEAILTFDSLPSLQIEIVANQDLETFMKTNIWTPLGMNSTTFRPWSRPDLEEKFVELAWRGRDGKLTKGKNPYGPAVDCCGGVGLFSTPRDQARLLAALLKDGHGVMSKASLDELMSPQTEDPSHFLSIVCGTKRAHLGQTWPEGSNGDFGLSSSINATDFPGRRAANSANWQGMPGIHAVSLYTHHHRL